MSKERLLELLKPYRTFDATGAEEMREAIAGATRREYAVPKAYFS